MVSPWPFKREFQKVLNLLGLLITV